LDLLQSLFLAVVEVDAATSSLTLALVAGLLLGGALTLGAGLALGVEL